MSGLNTILLQSYTKVNALLFQALDAECQLPSPHVLVLPSMENGHQTKHGGASK